MSSFQELPGIPKSEAVRDLWWSLLGPGLLDPTHSRFVGRVLADPWFAAQVEKSREWFERCDANSATLEQVVSSQVGASPLLGRYFEALIAYWIRECLRPESLKWGFVFNEGGRTLGELDFLFRPKGETVWQHWEASVKFYLCAARSMEEALDPRFFVGPMTRDRLDIKIDKLFEHQLRMPESPEARKTLDAAGVGKVESRAWMKGMLFYPLNVGKWPTPTGVSDSHARGWWCTSDQIEFLGDERGEGWVLLSRHRWLSPVFSPEPGLSRGQMMQSCAEHFERHLSPLMWAEIRASESGIWCEIRRGIVVSPRWPEEAYRAACI